MKTNTFNNRQTGSAGIGYAGWYDDGQERYHNLLREAEQSRLEHRAARSSANGQPTLQGKSPITRLLMWVGIF